MHHAHDPHRPDHDDHGPASFDERAATWDDDAKVARAGRVTDAVLSATGVDRLGPRVAFGAGTALVTEALGDRVGPSVLADTSAGIREVMATKVAEGRLPRSRVVDWDLGAESIPVDIDEQFDLIVTVLTLHHVEDVDRVLGRFADLLAPGGRVAVADLDAEDGSFHGDGFTGHHGFERDDLVRRLVAAGLDEVTVSDCGVLERDEGTYPMFLAVARSSQARTGGAGS